MKGWVVQVSISGGGVPNYPVGRGRAAMSGFEGDGWRHPQFHGIPRRAVLLITEEGLEEIRAMGFPVFPGALGENLTTRGLDRLALRSGQRWRCGSAVIELTEPRLPCDTLSSYGRGIQAAIYDLRAMKGDSTSPVWGLSGFYGAVVEPGVVEARDSIELIR